MARVINVTSCLKCELWLVEYVSALAGFNQLHLMGEDQLCKWPITRQRHLNRFSDPNVLGPEASNI